MFLTFIIIGLNIYNSPHNFHSSHSPHLIPEDDSDENEAGPLSVTDTLGVPSRQDVTRELDDMRVVQILLVNKQ